MVRPYPDGFVPIYAPSAPGPRSLVGRQSAGFAKPRKNGEKRHMDKPLNGIKVAVLVGNGFDEADMTQCQRALLVAGASVRVIGVDQGLVNGWQGRGWGHHFAVDTPLSAALAADFAMLVVPGGQRSLDKLKQTAHTRRFIGGFLAATKPIAMFGDAIQLLAHTGHATGRTLGGPAEMEPDMIQAGANWSHETLVHDGNLLTGVSNDETREAFIASVIAHFTGIPSLAQAA